MSMPKDPTNEEEEYIEDKAFENVSTSLHQGNDPIYLTPEQDMEDRGTISVFVPTEYYIHKAANGHTRRHQR